MKETFRKWFPENEINASQKRAEKLRKINAKIEAKRKKEEKKKDEIERLIISIVANLSYMKNISYNEQKYVAPNGKSFVGVLICEGSFDNQKAIIAIDRINEKAVVTIKYGESNMKTLTWCVQLLGLPREPREPLPQITQTTAQDKLYLYPLNHKAHFKDFLQPRLLGKTTLRTLKKKFPN